jgi:hypothetical protein
VWRSQAQQLSRLSGEQLAAETLGVEAGALEVSDGVREPVAVSSPSSRPIITTGISTGIGIFGGTHWLLELWDMLKLLRFGNRQSLWLWTHARTFAD